MNRIIETPSSSLSFLLVALALGVAVGCQKPANAEGDSSRVAAASVVHASQATPLSSPEKIRYSPDVLATGTLKPRQSALLAMAVPGTLLRLFAKKGDEVKAGAVLATLDSAAARASFSQAEAGVIAAQAQLRLAEDALRRVTAMHKDDAVPESQLVQTQGQRDLAAAQLEVVVAQREQAGVLLRNHTLTAPFAGVIIHAPDGTGMPVGPQAPLFAIENVRSLLLESSITQEEAVELPRDAKVSLVVPATGVRVDDASVRLVMPSVDPATNRVPIEIAVPNENGKLLPHSFVRARLPSSGEREAYRVRQGSLTQHDGEFSVWIAGPDGNAHTVRARVYGQQEDGFAIVDFGPNGFPQGAKVVDVPPANLTEGTPLVARTNRDVQR